MNLAKKKFGNSFPKIITVARLDKRKGHDKILMTIKNLKIKFPKIKYISVGSGDQENNLLELTKGTIYWKRGNFSERYQL